MSSLASLFFKIRIKKFFRNQEFEPSRLLSKLFNFSPLINHESLETRLLTVKM